MNTNKSTPNRAPAGVPSRVSKGRIVRYLLAAFAVFMLLSSVLSWLGFATSAGDWGRAFRRSVSGMTGVCLSCKRNEIDPQLPFVKALNSDKVETSLTDQATAFAKANHLQILLDNGTFQYSIYAGGEKIVLFNTAPSAEGLASAADLLSKAVDAKIADMAKEPLQANFSVENEFVEKQHAYDKDGQPTDGDVAVLARRPMLHELYGVEAALKHSNPSHLGPGNKTGIKFYFLKERFYKNDNAAAYYDSSDKDHRAAVMINPGALDKLWITEADAPSWASAQRFRAEKPIFWDTIESLLMHELAHNHQSRLGWDNDATMRQQMAERTGFVILENPGKIRAYFIKVKATGEQTELYKLDVYSPSKPKTWLRVDAQGQLLDSAGLAVDAPEKAKQLSNEQVKQGAVVRPATDYFDTPLEIFADAMKMFRMGGTARLALLQNSPTLYLLIKEQDQKEINLYFGYIKVKESRTAVAGDKEKELEPLDFDEPQFLRNWSGQVVKASKQEEFAVYREENQAVNVQP